jgi:hypothetical protein
MAESLSTYQISLIAILRAEVAEDAIIHAIGTDTSLSCFFWSCLWFKDAVTAHTTAVIVAVVIFLMLVSTIQRKWRLEKLRNPPQRAVRSSSTHDSSFHSCLSMPTNRKEHTRVLLPP